MTLTTPAPPGHYPGQTGASEPPKTGPAGLTKTGLRRDGRPSRRNQREKPSVDFNSVGQASRISGTARDSPLGPRRAIPNSRSKRALLPGRHRTETAPSRLPCRIS